MGLSLDAYFARIGYSGSTEPTLATLSELVRAHASAIPFENLDVLLGRRIGLDEDVGVSLSARAQLVADHAFCSFNPQCGTPRASRRASSISRNCSRAHAA